MVATGDAPPIDGGAELRSFTDAMGGDLTVDLTDERMALVERLGPASAERAAAVAATFQMMNRLLDAVGAPVRGRTHFTPVAEAMGFRMEDIPR